MRLDATRVAPAVLRATRYLTSGLRPYCMVAFLRECRMARRRALSCRLRCSAVLVLSVVAACGGGGGGGGGSAPLPSPRFFRFSSLAYVASETERGVLITVQRR